MSTPSALQFCKVLPSGNPTILLHGILPKNKSLATLANRLMDPMHITGEQTGYLDISKTPPHLQMMGGEFCVNATRAAGLLLTQSGKVIPLAPGLWGASLTVSGASKPLTVYIAQDHAIFNRHLSGMTGPLPDANLDPPLERPVKAFIGAKLSYTHNDIAIQEVAPGVALVKVPGITHLLLDTLHHPLPDQPHTAAKKWRHKTGLEHCEAAGVIWYDRLREAHSYAIAPLVHVKATQTAYMETACGSASLALSLWLNQESSCPPTVTVRQPSGQSLHIYLGIADTAAAERYAIVAGPVHCLAEGTAYLI